MFLDNTIPRCIRVCNTIQLHSHKIKLNENITEHYNKEAEHYSDSSVIKKEDSEIIPVLKSYFTDL